MAQTAYPFDSGAGANVSQQQWWRMGQMLAPDGVLSALGGGTAGELLCFGDASGMVAKVSPGQAWVKGVYFENDALYTTPALGAAHASLDRIDLVVVRINWVAFTGTITILVGSPAVTPTPPTPSATPGNLYDLPLAQVRVRAQTTTILAGDVTDTRVFTDLQTQIPAGVMFDWATATAPRGYLACAGQPVSRVRYAALFAAIGTAYGAGDGLLTFTLPDFRGRVAVTLDNLGGTSANRLPGANTVGGTGGAATHAMTAAELVTHVHTINLGPTGSDVASADHLHTITPPATNSLGESTQHTHAMAPPTATSGTENQLHTHQVNPPLTTSISTGNHQHSVPAINGTTLTDAAPHGHTVTLGGTTSTPTANHRHGTGMGFASGTGGTLSASGVTGSAPEQLTGNDLSAHAHEWGASGTTSGVTSPHSHVLAIPADMTGLGGAAHTHDVDIPPFTSDPASPGHTHSLNLGSFSSGVNAPNHAHTVAIPAFVSQGQTANHLHNVTLTGATGGTGSTTPFNTMPPYLIVAKIIKT